MKFSLDGFVPFNVGFVYQHLMRWMYCVQSGATKQPEHRPPCCCRYANSALCVNTSRWWPRYRQTLPLTSRMQVMLVRQTWLGRSTAAPRNRYGYTLCCGCDRNNPDAPRFFCYHKTDGGCILINQLLEHLIIINDQLWLLPRIDDGTRDACQGALSSQGNHVALVDPGLAHMKGSDRTFFEWPNNEWFIEQLDRMANDNSPLVMKTLGAMLERFSPSFDFEGRLKSFASKLLQNGMSN